MARLHHTSNSAHSLDRSTSMPLSSKSTPSPFNSCSFLSVLMPLGAFCHSPLKPPTYYAKSIFLSAVSCAYETYAIRTDDSVTWHLGCKRISSQCPSYRPWTGAESLGYGSVGADFACRDLLEQRVNASLILGDGRSCRHKCLLIDGIIVCCTCFSVAISRLGGRLI